MPANIVKPGQEAAWERAKRAVRRQYPDINEDNPRFYKLTTTIFNNMKALDAMDLIDEDGDAEAHRTGHLHKAVVGLVCTPPRVYAVLAKAYVRAHTRTTPSGRTIHIPAYFTKRTAAQKEGAKPRKARALKEQPSAQIHPGQSHEQLAHRLVRHVHEGSMSHEEAEANLAHLERRAHAGHHLEHGTGAAWTPEQTHQFIAHARGRLAEHKAGQEREASEKQWREAHEQAQHRLRAHVDEVIETVNAYATAKQKAGKRVRAMTEQERSAYRYLADWSNVKHVEGQTRILRATDGTEVLYSVERKIIRLKRLEGTQAEREQQQQAQSQRIEELTGKREQAEPQGQEPGRQGPPRGITQQERQQQWDAQMRQRQQAERERAQRQARPSQTAWQQQEQALRGQARGRFEEENQRRGRPVAKSRVLGLVRRTA
jgi:hypothetical protein